MTLVIVAVAFVIWAWMMRLFAWRLRMSKGKPPEGFDYSLGALCAFGCMIILPLSLAVLLIMEFDYSKWAKRIEREKRYRELERWARNEGLMD
jgi:hypothetical protein